MAILVLFLVVVALVADALIFFVAGYVVATQQEIKTLMDRGWTIKPPEECHHEN